jgi:nitroreductase
MNFEKDLTELIRSRFSCRNFRNKKLDYSTRDELDRICKSANKGLFGEKLSLFFVERTGNDQREIHSGGFEYIINPLYFIAGKIENTKYAYESFGYILEQIVLKATDMDLGTCWIGYFNPPYFYEVQLCPGEVFPAIIILGYPAEKATHADIFKIRLFAGGGNRRKWDKLFFIKDFNNPLTKDVAGIFCEPLEMLRLAPSSGNTQPWRVVKEADANIFHFYKQVVSFHYELKKLHNIDIGIAMCHFDLVAGNAGLYGTWEDLNPDIKMSGNTEYIISWVEK